MTTTSKVTADGTTLEKKLFDSIMKGAAEQHILLPLISDVSSQFNPGTKSFEVFQWGLAGNVVNTPEDGSEVSDGGMPIYSDVVACDQDKTVAYYQYDKGAYLSAVDYVAGFVGSAGFKHARNIESYVAGLMRAGANTTIKLSGDPAGGTLNSEFTEADLEKLALAFDDANLPAEGRRLIVNHRQKHALIRAFGLKAVDASGDSQALRNAQVGRLYGFDIYEGNTNILPVNANNQALAFVASSCWWGLGINPTVERERQASKARTYYGVRARFGAKVNALEDADGNAQNKIWLIGNGAAS